MIITSKHFGIFKIDYDGMSESRKSVSSSVKLAIIWINKCLEFYILLVNSKKLRTLQKVLKYTKNNVHFCSW